MLDREFVLEGRVLLCQRVSTLMKMGRLVML